MAREVEKTLSPYELARLRTEMYFGSRELNTQSLVGYRPAEGLAIRSHTWVPAVWTALREIIDNALDEMVGHKHGDTLTVNYDEPNMIFEVKDNGRGIPIHEIPAVGKGPAASIMLSVIGSGRNYEERKQVGGANGLGAAVVNFTSEWFELESDRDGTQDKHGAKNLTQRWEHGVKDGKEIHKTKGPHVIRGNKNRSGTMIRFKLSQKVFPKQVLPTEFVQERLWDLAVINPKIKIIFNGERLQPLSVVDPIKSMFFPNNPCAVAQVDYQDFHSRFYVVGYSEDSPEIDHTIINNIPAFDGGKHLDTFKTLFYAVATEEIEKRVKKDIKGVKVTRAMISPGVMIWNNTTMHGPTFDSQSKTRLTSNVGEFVRNGFHESDIRSFLRRNPEWVDAIIKRVKERYGKQSDKDKKKTERSVLQQKVARLIDATGRNKNDNILFLFEGDSAQGLFPQVRNPKIHGYLPLLGKPANVWGMTDAAILQDRVLAQIMTALGLKVSEPLSARQLRYGKVYIAADEDDDGANITTLLINFFYSRWKMMFDVEKPVLYRFQTPFVSLKKGSETKYIYEQDYAEYTSDTNKYKGWTSSRKKGLGKLEAEDWEYALENPSLIPITDDGNLGETLDMIFNKTRSNDRKDWLRKRQGV